jgi:hypothetical protein
MKNKIDIKSLALGVLLGAAIVFSIGAATPSGSTVWEYKVVRGNIRGNNDAGELDKYINNAIAGGWDFVSASPLGDQSGFAVLKRGKK